MRCPDCGATVRDDARGCICGWIAPAQPQRNVRDHEERSGPVLRDYARAREALRDIGNYTSRHLRNVRTREQIVENWRWVKAHPCSKDAYNMACAALRKLGAEEDREPGQDDDEGIDAR